MDENITIQSLCLKNVLFQYIVSLVSITVCYGTFVHMWINVKGLIAWEDAAVPVELFTERERSVQAIHPLIGMISYCEILKIHVLEKTNMIFHNYLYN